MSKSSKGERRGIKRPDAGWLESSGSLFFMQFPIYSDLEVYQYIIISLNLPFISESRWLATPKGSLVRGYDKPRLMGVTIAIDPFTTVVYIHVLYTLLKIPLLLLIEEIRLTS